MQQFHLERKLMPESEQCRRKDHLRVPRKPWNSFSRQGRRKESSCGGNAPSSIRPDGEQSQATTPGLHLLPNPLQKAQRTGGYGKHALGGVPEGGRDAWLVHTVKCPDTLNMSQRHAGAPSGDLARFPSMPESTGASSQVEVGGGQLLVPTTRIPNWR